MLAELAYHEIELMVCVEYKEVVDSGREAYTLRLNFLLLHWLHLKIGEPFEHL